MSIEKSTMKGLGFAAAIVALLVSQFWGVPYYIQSEVTRQVNALNGEASTPENVTTLIAQMSAVQGNLVTIDSRDIRIEKKIDDLNALFVGYLERQASRDD